MNENNETKEEVTAGSGLSEWLDAALKLHEERFRRIMDSWLREETTWIALDVERIRLRGEIEKLARVFEEEVQPYLSPRPGATYADGMNDMARNCARIARETLSA